MKTVPLIISLTFVVATEVSAEVLITGSSVQSTVLSNGAVINNLADGIGTIATQNLATNAGTVTIGGASRQTVTVEGANLYNEAMAGDAIQNLASNADHVTVLGSSTQTVSLHGGATLLNKAEGGGSWASQNLASNFGHIDIGGSSIQIVDVANSSVTNLAQGPGAYAAQNFASNFGHVLITGSSNQSVSIIGSTVMNIAGGGSSSARQSMSTNTSCNVDASCSVNYRSGAL